MVEPTAALQVVTLVANAAGFFLAAGMMAFATWMQIQLIGSHWESITLVLVLIAALFAIQGIRRRTPPCGPRGKVGAERAARELRRSVMAPVRARGHRGTRAALAVKPLVVLAAAPPVWVDGTAMIDLGTAPLPPPGDVVFANLPKLDAIELYQRRPTGDVRAETGLGGRVGVALPPGEWFVFWKIGERIDARAFTIRAGAATKVELGAR